MVDVIRFTFHILRVCLFDLFSSYSRFTVDNKGTLIPLKRGIEGIRIDNDYEKNQNCDMNKGVISYKYHPSLLR